MVVIGFSKRRLVRDGPSRRLPGQVPGGYPTLKEGLASGLAPRTDAHLGVEVGQVALDGSLGDREGGRYLAVAQAPGREKQDLELPCRGFALGFVLYPFEYLAGDRQHHVPLARSQRTLRSGADCSEEPFDRGA